ncbi:MAG: hypothetical protein NC037_05580 [Bacteroides sp.]|nr:hypothetical protein [Bacillota bacterium]MCM1393841.1 hypothetical protein [[Eubacterium] siraeum]MCM1455976.1 hypothetical protein [Bacteroides sp.]
MKVWAKVMKGDKILNDVIYEENLPLNQSGFQTLMQEVAYKLDVATPVILATHLKHLERFNRVKFLARDFIEDVDFDVLIVERVLDDKKPKLYLNY